MKKVSDACILGGVVVLELAIIEKMLNSGLFLVGPAGLWKVSIALLLIAIALGVNKE